MERILAIVLMLACFRCLAGCASAPQTDYTFSFQGDPGDYSLALEATADWNRCGVVHVTMNRGGEGIPILMTEDLVNVRADGETAPDGSWIKYRPWQSPVIKHEMGHVFMGPEHYGEGLMHDKILDHRVSDEDCRRLGER